MDAQPDRLSARFQGPRNGLESAYFPGGGTHGELGQGASTNANYYPAQVPGLTNIIRISAGWFHILALKADGTVWGWGNNSNASWATVPRSTGGLPNILATPPTNVVTVPMTERQAVFRLRF